MQQAGNDGSKKCANADEPADIGGMFNQLGEMLGEMSDLGKVLINLPLDVDLGVQTLASMLIRTSSQCLTTVCEIEEVLKAAVAETEAAHGERA